MCLGGEPARKQRAAPYGSSQIDECVREGKGEGNEKQQTKVPAVFREDMRKAWPSLLAALRAAIDQIPQHNGL